MKVQEEAKHNSRIKSIALWLVGMGMCVIPPVICILLYFPIWAAMGGEYIVSGFTVLLLITAAMPLYRAVKTALRSPAGYTVWLILFIIFFTMSKIAEQMAVVSLVGFLGNLVGALFFRMSRKDVRADES